MHYLFAKFFGLTSSILPSIIRHYNAHLEWTQTIEDIRKVAGLESFLQRPSYTQLQQASSDGPVIIVNISERRSDAIIILRQGDPILVPLPNATPQLIQNLADGLGGRPAELHDNDLAGILRELWDSTVGPIVSKLRTLIPDGSRIWWICTGAASKLPFHAAGPYKRGEQGISQLYISSYTPTLGTLIRARQARTAGPQVKYPTRSVLLVGQPNTPNERPLPKVLEEMCAVQKHAPHATTLEDKDGTRDAVLLGLTYHSWLHLACHGHHNASKPFMSHFSMHDGPLSLLDLIEKDLPHAELAILSACHSARVSEALPDEVLHAAAGMLFAGFKSVIGTMWALDDGIGSALADRFYKRMLGGKKGPKDCSEAAVNLEMAFRMLEKAGHRMSLAQRVNVIHFGI